MNARICFFLIICLMTFRAQGQTKCLNSHKTFDDRTPLYKKQAANITKHAEAMKWRPRSEKWLPVVVHVVLPDPQAITLARILQQIDGLNRDFAARNENLQKLSPEFEPLVADTEIRFCLAGVTYTQTDIGNIALAKDINGRTRVYYDELDGKTGWDPSKYINIWIAEFGNGIIGYGSMPGTAPYPEENGVVIDPLYFGSYGLGTQYFEEGHSLTHEMGHFLGLIHIWGDDGSACIGTDEVEDTPNAAGPYLGCPVGTHASCGSNDMYQNFMDFTDDRCLAVFTHGQAQRMQAAIDLYYTDLPVDATCYQTTASFDEWSGLLKWGYDSESKEWIFFSETGFDRNVRVDVFLPDGRMLRSEKMDRALTYFPALDMPAGIYIVIITEGDHRLVRKIAVY